MAESTEQVFNHHLQAFGLRDLDGLLADYAPDVTFILAGGPVVKGSAGLKPLFEGFIQEFGRPDVIFTPLSTTIEGEIAVLTWSAETPEKVYDFGSETFIIRDGKIVSQVTAMTSRAK
jgi:ketosteroid isomerase-like protein